MSNLGAGLKSQHWDMATMPKFEKSFCKTPRCNALCMNIKLTKL
jgi:hypothetical protein